MLTKKLAFFLALGVLTLSVGFFAVPCDDAGVAEAAVVEVSDVSVDVEEISTDVAAEAGCDDAQLAGDAVNNAGVQGYECPRNRPYCSRDSQCDSFCGGDGGDCTFGCCACAF